MSVHVLEGSGLGVRVYPKAPKTGHGIFGGGFRLWGLGFGISHYEGPGALG